MTLNGYRRACGKRSGGIRSVALARAGAVARVEPDGADGYLRVALAPDEEFARYTFREDEARYTETVTADGLVTHSLSFTLERMDPTSAAAIGQLCAASPEGLVAIVETNSDVALLVGWSGRFGGRYPLRLSRGLADSGRLLTDPGTESVELTSVDTCKAQACGLPDLTD